jgi:predicted secreted protein
VTARDQERRGRERSRQPLPVREILDAAARAGRSDPWRIIAVAVAVSLLTVLLDFVATDLLDNTNIPLLIASTASSWLLSVLGTVFLSGLLCRIVGQAEHGRDRASLWQVARHLPWSRLVRGDMLMFVLVVLGVIALVIPGVVMFTLFALAGPVIEIENRPVWAALRRSARLVRPHFWWVALFAAVPLAVPIRVQVGPDSGSRAPTVGHVVEAVVLHGFVEALIEAAVGLVLVELCFRLVDLDKARQP